MVTFTEKILNGELHFLYMNAGQAGFHNNATYLLQFNSHLYLHEFFLYIQNTVKSRVKA